MQNLANNSDALDAQQAAVAKKIRECQCGNFADATTGERIGCHAETTRTFAPGHDAKLKSLLIRIGVEGHQVKVLGEDTPQGTGTVANRYGFSGQVLRGIIKGRANKAPKAAPAPTFEIIEVPIRSGKALIFTAAYEGVTATRTSKTRVYTHAAVYNTSKGTVIGSWHSSEALAAKGVNGLKPIAVVEVTAR